MKKSILFLLGIALFITSCDKDDDSSNTNPTPTPSTCVITKSVDLKDNSYINITYASNKVATVEEFDSTDTKTSSFSTTYSGGKLIEMVMKDSLGNITQSFNYIYHNDLPDTIFIYMDANDDGTIDTINIVNTFNSSLLASSSMFFDIGTGVMTEVQKQEYVWSGDNITEIKEYSLSITGLDLSTITTYEFDDKKNYKHNIGLNYMPLSTESLNVNNYIKKTVKDASNVVDNDKSTDYFNEYDSDGKLLKATIVTFNNDTLEINVNTYTCN